MRYPDRQPARSAAFGGTAFQGAVRRIDTRIDPATRRLHVRVTEKPPGGKGRAGEWPAGEHLPPEDPRVIFQRNNARWHTDSSYRFVPSLASVLYGVEVLPDGAEGGETGGEPPDPESRADHGQRYSDGHIQSPGGPSPCRSR